MRPCPLCDRPDCPGHTLRAVAVDEDKQIIAFFETMVKYKTTWPLTRDMTAKAEKAIVDITPLIQRITQAGATRAPDYATAAASWAEGMASERSAFRDVEAQMKSLECMGEGFTHEQLQHSIEHIEKGRKQDVATALTGMSKPGFVADQAEWILCPACSGTGTYPTGSAPCQLCNGPGARKEKIGKIQRGRAIAADLSPGGEKTE